MLSWRFKYLLRKELENITTEVTPDILEKASKKIARRLEDEEEERQEELKRRKRAGR